MCIEMYIGISFLHFIVKVNNKIIEQVNTFNYLGNLVSYEKEKDTHNKITKFLRIRVTHSNQTKSEKVHE
jgi:hypothetical protein